MKSKKSTLWIILIAIVAVIIAVGAVIIYKMQDDSVNDEVPEVVVEPEPELSEEEKLSQQIDEEISEMTLREKIGQMITIAYRQEEYTDELDNILKEVEPGGFILFSENISTYDGTTSYIKKIRENEKIPMFISIDQEGGRVQRIKNLPDANVLEIPTMYSLGQTGDTELSYNVGSVLAQEIKAFGINMDFAPSLDVFSNPNNTVIGDRAFGSDAQTVINMALPFAKAMSENGVIPVYKHFPGHGDTEADSHVELPVVNKTKEELYERELLTFKAAVEADAQMIMIAHIALPNITGSYIPASLSKDIVDGILRKELGFNGVVITDAIEMKALADNYSLEEICSNAINAGVDIILMPPDPITAVDTIEQLVQNGEITQERIDESVKRILTMKHKNNMYEEQELNKENIGTQEHIDIINSVY